MAEGTLVRSTNWIGDAVMSLAALREIRRLFPDEPLLLLARRWVSGVFADQGLVDEIIPVEDLGWTSIRRRFGGFARTILFPNAFRAALEARWAGIPERVGYATDKRRWLLTRHAVPQIKRLQRHQVYYYLDLLHQSGLSDIDYLASDQFQPDTSLQASPQIQDRARDLLKAQGVDLSRPLLVLNPGATFGAAKRWLPGRYAQSADRLVEECGLEAVTIGSEVETPLARRIAQDMSAPLRILSGLTDLPTLIGVLSQADCLLTNDSGPMHLAAALDVPQVALFGSTDEIATGPLSARARVLHKHVECSPCLLRECPIDLRCFERIGVSEVVEAAKAVMNNG